MKVYVEVLARFGVDGTMVPVSFRWEDGRECHLYYEFDKWFTERRSA